MAISFPKDPQGRCRRLDSTVLLIGGFLLLPLLLTGMEAKPGGILLEEAVSYRQEGRELQEAGELQRSAASYRRAIGIKPDYAEAYNDLGVVLETLGDSAGAEQAYLAAVKYKPDLAAAHTNLALLYEETNRPQAASEHWAARANLGGPEDAWAAKARQRLGRPNLPVPPQAPGDSQSSVHR